MPSPHFVTYLLHFMKMIEEKQALLLAEILKLSPVIGFGNDCLKQAVKNLALQENYEKILFPNGALDVAIFFHKKIDSDLFNSSTDDALANLKIREKITFMITQRFKLLEPHKHALEKIIRFMALPQNAMDAMGLAWETADKMWYKAGDKATDFNYYSKRLTLVTVISASTLYFINDTSKDNEKTREFVKARIDNIINFKQLKEKFLKKICN